MSDELEPQAFPLDWPIGRARAKYRQAAPFKHQRRAVEIPRAVRLVLDELRRFGARSPVISSNVRPTLGGGLHRESPTNGDPGVAVYFRLADRPHCVSCDRWTRVADNLVAVAKDIEAQRGRLRWGCVDAIQAFAGQRLLPAAEQRTPWWVILGFKDPPSSAAEIDQAERAGLLRYHPDKFPGNDGAREANSNAAAEITAAASEGREVLRLQAATT